MESGVRLDQGAYRDRHYRGAREAMEAVRKTKRAGRGLRQLGQRMSRAYGISAHDR
jgi:hypothetical protein